MLEDNRGGDPGIDVGPGGVESFDGAALDAVLRMIVGAAAGIRRSLEARGRATSLPARSFQRALKPAEFASLEDNCEGDPGADAEPGGVESFGKAALDAAARRIVGAAAGIRRSLEARGRLTSLPARSFQRALKPAEFASLEDNRGEDPGIDAEPGGVESFGKAALDAAAWAIVGAAADIRRSLEARGRATSLPARSFQRALKPTEFDSLEGNCVESFGGAALDAAARGIVEAAAGIRRSLEARGRSTSLPARSFQRALKPTEFASLEDNCGEDPGVDAEPGGVESFSEAALDAAARGIVEAAAGIRRSFEARGRSTTGARVDARSLSRPIARSFGGSVAAIKGCGVTRNGSGSP